MNVTHDHILPQGSGISPNLRTPGRDTGGIYARTDARAYLSHGGDFGLDFVVVGELVFQVPQPWIHVCDECEHDR